MDEYCQFFPDQATRLRALLREDCPSGTVAADRE